jgi:hypothetical protein
MPSVMVFGLHYRHLIICNTAGGAGFMAMLWHLNKRNGLGTE